MESRIIRVMAHVCPYCDGCWLDKGELAVLRHASADITPQEVQPVTEGPRIRCPRCEIEMEQRRFNQEHHTIIDECMQCEGIWLDGSELKTIVSGGRQG